MADPGGLANNPFAALFQDIKQAEAFSATRHDVLPGKNEDSGQRILDSVTDQDELEKLSKQGEDEESLKQQVKLQMEINALIENIFLITVDKEMEEEDVLEGRPSRSVFIAELADSIQPQTWLDLDCLEQAVFQRLLMTDPGSFILAPGKGNPSPKEASLAGESEVLRYLFQCYSRYRSMQNEGQFGLCKEAATRCKEVLLLNAKTCLQQPELYPTQQFHKQFVDLYVEQNDYLSDGESYVKDFFVSVAAEIDSNKEDGTVCEAFTPVLDMVADKFKQDLTILHTEVNRYISLLLFFTSSPPLAKAFIDYNTPKDVTKGKSFETTLIGSILSLSCIPKSDAGPYLFFEKPASSSSQEHGITEQNIWRLVSNLCRGAHLLVFSLVKVSAEVRHQMMSWIGHCLSANSGRAKMWSAHAPQMFGALYCSDGFSLNLCTVMLMLCKPFSEPCSQKLLRIQPSYVRAVAADDQQARQRNIHAQGLEKETCLIPSEGSQELEEDSVYTFITECFYLTHQAVYIGFHNVHEKFLKLNRELHRIETLYRDLRAQYMNDDVEPVRGIKQQYEKGLTIYLTLKAALTEPQLMELCMNFHLSTSTWLVQVARCDDVTDFQPITFPLPLVIPRTLAYTPELIMGNVTDYTMFLHRFKDDMYEMGGERLEHFMTLILVYMGSPDRMRNPHLRAELAETLEALMPPSSQKSSGQQSILSKFYRERLFKDHPLLVHLPEKLIHVFVSIEMTGESVQFEQKFNYRQPMYNVLKYIWESEAHRSAIMMLAEYAEEHIEDTDPPLFLRFINLLINDAIFLLDEALDYMKQLKEKQLIKEGEEWRTMTPRQQQEHDGNMRQLGSLARIHNQLGNVTIFTLEMITQKIKSIFCNPVMVDRISGMLNYFLVHLVGPKQREFKVQDMREKYHFKPEEFVSNIAKIYLNLCDKQGFCQAVAGDGRSYSPELFPKALHVLQRIGSPPAFMSDFQSLHEKILGVSAAQKMEEELFADPPDEFCDPMMGTFMTDPVTLPTSGNTVDRSTIARILLSDQMDPYNRQPLTMDMIVPNTKLKADIERWKEEQRAKKRNADSGGSGDTDGGGSGDTDGGREEKATDSNTGAGTTDADNKDSCSEENTY